MPLVGGLLLFTFEGGVIQSLTYGFCGHSRYYTRLLLHNHEYCLEQKQNFSRHAGNNNWLSWLGKQGYILSEACLSTSPTTNGPLCGVLDSHCISGGINRLGIPCHTSESAQLQLQYPCYRVCLVSMVILAHALCKIGISWLACDFVKNYGALVKSPHTCIGQAY